MTENMITRNSINSSFPFIFIDYTDPVKFTERLTIADLDRRTSERTSDDLFTHFGALFRL